MKRVMEEMRCEGAVLLGKNAVKQGVDRRINRMWAAALDLSHDLAIGYRLAGRNTDAMKCLKGGEKLANELNDSLTRVCPFST